MSAQESMFDVCDKCGEEHSDGNWALCHACAGPVFRAWYIAMALPSEAEAIFAGLLGALVWRAR